MLQGENVALFKQTVCYLSAKGKRYDGAQCMILFHDASTRKWRVQLCGSEWRRRELSVPEASIRVSFCLLPLSIRRLQLFVKLESEDAQGACGRGLVLQEAVQAGLPIFSEPPLIVAGALVSSMSSKHAERWKAYTTLRFNAQMEARSGGDARAIQAGAKEASGMAGGTTALDGPLATAVAAFNALGIGERLPLHVRESATRISALEMDALQPPPSPAQRAAHAEEVYGVVLSLQTECFKPCHGLRPPLNSNPWPSLP